MQTITKNRNLAATKARIALERSGAQVFRTLDAYGWQTFDTGRVHGPVNR